MLSAYLTWTLVAFHYIVNEKNRKNFIDEKVTNFIRCKTPMYYTKNVNWEPWTAAMEASVLMYSDTQVITGLAILLSGYTQLHLGLTSYHWEMVVCLAWFSSLTHLATLSSLREYFLKRRSMAICRASFMGVILILLAVSYGTTGYIPQSQGATFTFSWPAICLFSTKGMSEIGISMDWRGEEQRPAFNKPLVVLSIMFLVISYLTRVIGIFESTTKLASHSFRDISKYIRSRYTAAKTRAEKGPKSASKNVRKVIRFVWALVYVILKALFAVAGSMLWDVGFNFALILLYFC